MKEDRIFEIICPHCGATIWIDRETKGVIKTERAPKKKETLEDLLAKERERRATFDHKFEATAELAKKKKEKAREKFDQALEKLEEE